MIVLLLRPGAAGRVRRADGGGAVGLLLGGVFTPGLRLPMRVILDRNRHGAFGSMSNAALAGLAGHDAGMAGAPIALVLVRASRAEVTAVEGVSVAV